MPYRWIRFLHIVSAIGFVGIHGASIVVLYAIRNERDRVRIEGILDFSSRTAVAMYVSLVAVVGTGIWMGFVRTTLFSQGWFWWSLALLIITSVVMFFVAKPFTKTIRVATEIRPSGVPRVSDEELAQVLRSPQTHLITAIGVLGLGAILYLMVFQPSLSFGAGAEPSASPITSEASLPPTEDTVSTPGTTPGTTIPSGDEEAVLALGKLVYDDTGRCAVCHAFDGQGSGNAPNIIGVSKSTISDALEEVPEMGDIKLSAEEREAVYRYVQTLPQRAELS